MTFWKRLINRWNRFDHIGNRNYVRTSDFGFHISLKSKVKSKSGTLRICKIYLWIQIRHPVINYEHRYLQKVLRVWHHNWQLLGQSGYEDNFEIKMAWKCNNFKSIGKDWHQILKFLRALTQSLLCRWRRPTCCPTTTCTRSWPRLARSSPRAGPPYRSGSWPCSGTYLWHQQLAAMLRF